MTVALTVLASFHYRLRLGPCKHQTALSDTFSDALIDAGWHVLRTTTSARAPSDPSSYDLIVLGVNTYWWAPDEPTLRYIERVGDFRGTQVVVLVSGAGATGRAERLIRERLTSSQARVLGVQSFWVLRPNDQGDPRPNIVVALKQASHLARDIADGYFARRLGASSALGSRLDVYADFAVTFAAIVGLTILNVYPPWLAPLVLAVFAQFIAGQRTSELQYDAPGRHFGTLLYGGIITTLALPDAATIRLFCLSVAILSAVIIMTRWRLWQP